MTDRSERAVGLFLQGHNCAQSVFASFHDVADMDFETALKLSSSFGAGMGRLREVCGALSAVFMIAGIRYGYTSPSDMEAKTEHYKLIQSLAEKFRAENKSIICRDLLGLGPGPDSPVPEERTAVYYKDRPCIGIIAFAAELAETLIAERDALAKSAGMPEVSG